MLINLSILLSPILFHEELLSYYGKEDWGVHEILHNKIQDGKNTPEHFFFWLVEKIEKVKCIACEK